MSVCTDTTGWEITLGFVALAIGLLVVALVTAVGATVWNVITRRRRTPTAQPSVEIHATGGARMVVVKLSSNFDISFARFEEVGEVLGAAFRDNSQSPAPPESDEPGPVRNPSC